MIMQGSNNNNNNKSQGTASTTPNANPNTNTQNVSNQAPRPTIHEDEPPITPINTQMSATPELFVSLTDNLDLNPGHNHDLNPGHNINIMSSRRSEADGAHETDHSHPATSNPTPPGEQMEEDEIAYT